jgi:cytochrome c biogenesis protein CcmG/thiol:disulfide interchange protein DsbE
MRLWHILVICIIAGIWSHYGDAIMARYLPGVTGSSTGADGLTPSRKRMPIFMAYTLDGAEMSSATLLQGRPAVLVFFAGWCPHCAAEIKQLKALKRKAPGVRFIGIIYNDTEKSVKNMLTLHGNPFDILLMDKGEKASRRVRLRGIPNNFIIDRQGMLRVRIDGGITEEQRVRLQPLLTQLEKE